MSRSLLDDNYAVQRAAMDVLLSDSKEGVPALRDHIAKYPSSKISSLARNELQRVKEGR
jgi:TolA-binding protein